MEGVASEAVSLVGCLGFGTAQGTSEEVRIRARQSGGGGEGTAGEEIAMTLYNTCEGRRLLMSRRRKDQWKR